jgi:hypothetical protein
MNSYSYSPADRAEGDRRVEGDVALDAGRHAARRQPEAGAQEPQEHGHRVNRSRGNLGIFESHFLVSS